MVVIGGFVLRNLPEKAPYDVRTTASPKLGRLFPREARWYKKLPGKKIQCQLCFRKCVVPNGEKGFCRNRKNLNGTYYTLVYGAPCALQVDPVEKEPLFHIHPGKTIFCLSTASCNFRCKFCHNWHLSQKSPEETYNWHLSPEDIVSLARKSGCRIISHTYAEPTVHYEYLLDIAKEAKRQGLKWVFHSNGSMTPGPLRELLKYCDGVCIDLKGFREEYYANMSQARLKPVLTTLKILKKKGVWVEIVNLVVPGGNDQPGTIREMCAWIKNNLGSEVPLHFTRFYPAHRLKNLPPTPVETLEVARKIARKVGLKYVYIGNVPGHKYNSTFCPKCGKVLIKRFHFQVLENNIVKGKCKFCGQPIPGIWD